MCSARVRLIRSTSAASVVLLPLPVAPVTSTRPRDSSARSTTDCGRPSDFERRNLRRESDASTRRWCRAGGTRSRGYGRRPAPARRRPLRSWSAAAPGAPAAAGASRWLRGTAALIGRHVRPALEVAVDAHERHVVGAQVDVRRAACAGLENQLIERHVPRSSSRRISRRSRVDSARALPGLMLNVARVLAEPIRREISTGPRFVRATPTPTKTVSGRELQLAGDRHAAFGTWSRASASRAGPARRR